VERWKKSKSGKVEPADSCNELRSRSAARYSK
jgi:hypothetical protein